MSKANSTRSRPKRRDAPKTRGDTPELFISFESAFNDSFLHLENKCLFPFFYPFSPFG